MKRCELAKTSVLFAAAALFSIGCGNVDDAQIEVKTGAVSGTGLGLGYHGGSGGSHNYNIQPLTGERVQDFRMWGGTETNALQIVYQNGGNFRVSAYVGGSGSVFNDLILNQGEYIYAVAGRSGAVNDQICVYKPVNGATGACIGGGGGTFWGVVQVPSPYQIAGIDGRYGNAIDKNQFWYYNP